MMADTNLLPEGLYKTKIVGVKMSRDANGKALTRIELKPIGLDQAVFGYNTGNTLVQWSFMKKIGAIVTIRIRHLLLEDFRLHSDSVITEINLPQEEPKEC